MKITSPIVNLFGTSPFGPIQEHMRLVGRCAQELPPMLAALAEGRRDEVKVFARRVSDLETEADEVKNRVRSALPGTFFLPVPRGDLLRLLAAQDKIADLTEDAANLLVLDRLRVTAGLGPALRGFCDEVVAVVSEAGGLIERLDELVEVGFRGREVERLLERIDEVAAMESATDEVERSLVWELLSMEEELGTLETVLWYELVRTLGRLADAAEDVGDRLRVLLAH